MLTSENWRTVKTRFEQASAWLLSLIADQSGTPSIQQVDALTKIALCEILDRYIADRIVTDKVLIGILKDIEGNTATIAEKSNGSNNQKGVQSMGKDQDKAISGSGLVEAAALAAEQVPAPQLDQEPAAPVPAEPAAPVPAGPAAAPAAPETPETPQTPDTGSGAE